MTDEVKIEFHDEGFISVLTSPGVQAVVNEAANMEASALGGEVIDSGLSAYWGGIGPRAAATVAVFEELDEGAYK